MAEKIPTDQQTAKEKARLIGLVKPMLKEHGLVDLTDFINKNCGEVFTNNPGFTRSVACKLEEIGEAEVIVRKEWTEFYVKRNTYNKRHPYYFTARLAAVGVIFSIIAGAVNAWVSDRLKSREPQKEIVEPRQNLSQTDSVRENANSLKRLPRAYLEKVVNEQKLDVLDQVFSEDYVFHEMNGADSYSIKDRTLRPFLESLFKAFPDLNYKIDLIVEEGDKVALYCTATGTNKHDFLGIKAAGNRVTFKEIFIFRINDHRIVEGWGVVDILGVQNQMRRN